MRENGWYNDQMSYELQLFIALCCHRETGEGTE